MLPPIKSHFVVVLTFEPLDSACLVTVSVTVSNSVVSLVFYCITHNKISSEKHNHKTQTQSFSKIFRQMITSVNPVQVNTLYTTTPHIPPSL